MTQWYNQKHVTPTSACSQEGLMEGYVLTQAGGGQSSGSGEGETANLNLLMRNLFRVVSRYHTVRLPRGKEWGSGGPVMALS